MGSFAIAKLQAKTRSVLAIALVAVMGFLTGCPDPNSGGGGSTPQVPPAPTGLSANALYSSVIYLSWDDVPEATGYNIYASASSSGTYTNLGQVSSSSAYNYDLPASATRYYRVTAYNSNGESGYSNTAYATTLASGIGGVGGSQHEATQLYAGRWAGGYLPVSGEQWFIFTATASTQYIHVFFDTLTDLYVQLYNSFGNMVGSSANLYGSTRYILLTLTVGQVYYIKVWPYSSGYSGTYQIAFNTSSAPPSGTGGGGGGHTHSYSSTYQSNATQHWRVCTSCYEESARANHTGNPCSVCSYSSNIGPSISIEMVYVPGGSFQMGSSDSSRQNERPVHTVTLSSFYMGKYEVTQAQYQAVMGSLPSRISSNKGMGDNYPVYTARWYDALVFCNKLSMAEGRTPAYRINGSTDPAAWGSVPIQGSAEWNAVTIDSYSTGYRLPTEAQWEYAAKGGNGSPGNYTYSGSNDVDDVAWYGSNSGNTSHVVGTKAPNGLGIHDMNGNVWEWCWDWFGDYSSETQYDPMGAPSGSTRVVRGGGWENSAASVTTTYRTSDGPYYWSLGSSLLRDDYHSFRIARPGN